MTTFRTSRRRVFAKSISPGILQNPKEPLSKVLKVTEVAAFQLVCGAWPAAVFAHGN